MLHIFLKEYFYKKNCVYNYILRSASVFKKSLILYLFLLLSFILQIMFQMLLKEFGNLNYMKICFDMSSK